MKHKKPHIFFACCLALLFSITGCKKKKAFKEENGQVAVDVRSIQAETDVALKDINEVMASRWQLRGRSTSVQNDNTLFGNICGLMVDTLSMVQGAMVLNYDGSLCSGRKRSGSIRVNINNYPAVKLKSRGCVVKVEFNNYEVIKSNGSSFQFNGTAYLNNESGDTWFELKFLNLPALIQSFTADNISITINSSNRLLYSISRRSTYTNTGNILKCSIEGAGSNSGKNNVESFGTTRNKDKFTSQVIIPVVWTSACGPLAPVGGECAVKEASKAFDLKCRYAVNNDGDLMYDDCAYGWQLTYTYKRKTKTRVFGYND